MRNGSLPAAVGRGVVAGAVGTAAITLSMGLENALRGKEETRAPARAARRITRIDLDDDEQELHLSRVIHWCYGTAWGALRGVLAAMGAQDPMATMVHFAVVSAVGMVMPPALGAMPKPNELGAVDVGATTVHHAVYAVATSAAYRALERQGSTSR